MFPTCQVGQAKVEPGPGHQTLGSSLAIIFQNIFYFLFLVCIQPVLYFPKFLLFMPCAADHEEWVSGNLVQQGNPLLASHRRC